MLRQPFHPLLHLLTQAVEIARRLLRRLAHAARGVVELAAHLLELPADLGDDRLEARLEFADRALRMGLGFVAQALDLLQRGLRLTRGIAGERRADLLGAGFRIAHRVLHHAGIGAHDVVELLRLGVDRVQQRDDRLMPAFQDRIDLGVGRIQRLGGGEDGLALILEALREPVDLVEQPARDLAQRLRLAGEDRDGFLRLRADLVCGLLHDRRIVGQHLVELRRLLAEGLGRGACVLAEHAVGLDRALVEGHVDRLQPFGESDDDGLRALGHGLVERSGLLADGGLERLDALEQRIGEGSRTAPPASCRARSRPD